MPDPRGRAARAVHALPIHDAVHGTAPASRHDAFGPPGPTPVAPSDVPRVPRPALRLVRADRPTDP
jgi:hypothetical protein